MILSLEHPILSNLLLVICLVGAMTGLTLLGRRNGARHLAGATEFPPGVSQVESAVFALFGLVVALTFYGAMERFQSKRALVLREAQSVGTAYARLDLLPEPVRRDLQARFRSYLRDRLDTYAHFSDLAAFQARWRLTEAQGEEIWRAASQACREPNVAVFAEVVLPALNEMFDVALARKAALGTHPPLVIYAFLIALAMANAYLSGFAMGPVRSPSWVHISGLAVVASLTIFVTLDMENPRLGLIRLDAADALLRGVLEAMR